MSENNNQLVLVGENYQIMTMNPQELREAIEENVGSTGLSRFDFERIKIPAGGGTTWEIPTLEGFEDAKNFEGFIVAWKDYKGYWSVPFEESGGGSPPDCHSNDGIFGIGNPGGECATCPLNQFGSAPKGEGKACKDIRTLLVVREGDILPVCVNVPPTSIKAVKQMFLKLVSKGMKFWQVAFRFELEKDKSDGGVTYSKLKLSIAGRLHPDKKAFIEEYVKSMKPILDSSTIIDVTDSYGDEDGESGGDAEQMEDMV